MAQASDVRLDGGREVGEAQDEEEEEEKGKNLRLTDLALKDKDQLASMHTQAEYSYEYQ